MTPVARVLKTLLTFRDTLKLICCRDATGSPWHRAVFLLKKYCPWNEIHIYCNSAKLKWVTLETRDTLDEILSGKLWNTRRMLKHVPSPPLKPILEPNPNSRGPTRPGGVSGKNQPTGAEEKVSPAKSFAWGGGWMCCWYLHRMRWAASGPTGHVELLGRGWRVPGHEKMTGPHGRGLCNGNKKQRSFAVWSFKAAF